MRRSAIVLSLVLCVIAIGCDNIAKRRIDSNISSSLVCTPGALQCNATLDGVEECRPEGYGFTTKETCSNGCNVESRSCNAVCRAGTTRCNGSALETCKSDGSGYDATTCANGCNGESGVCFGSCTPGSTVCNGDKLQTCADDGGGYTQTECKHGCNQNNPAAGCYETCRPGSQACDDAGNLGTCNADGSGYDTTPCANGCDASRLACFGEITADAGSPQTIVLGEGATLNATASGGDGNYTYSWSDGTTTIGSNAQINVEPEQTTVYTVTVTDGEGNTDTAQVTVTVNPRLVANAGDDQRVVRGDEVTLVGTSTGGVGNVSCIWFLGSSPVSSDCTYSFVPAKDSQLVLTVTDAEGHSASDAVEVRIFEPMQISVSAADPKLFAGESTTLVLTVEGGVLPLASCVWDDPAGSDDCHSIKVQVDQTTTFTVTVTDALGNTAKGSVTIEVVTLSAEAPDSVRICYVSGFELAVVGNAIGGIEPNRCEWWTDVANGGQKISDSCTLTGSYPNIPDDDTDAELRVYDSKGHGAKKGVDFLVVGPIGFLKKLPQFDIVVGESVSFNANGITFGGFEDTRTCEYADKDANVVASGCDAVSWTPDASQTYVLTVGDGTCPKASFNIPVTVHAVPTLDPIAGLHVAEGTRPQVSYTVTNTHPGAVCTLRKKGETQGSTIPCANGSNTTTLGAQSETTDYEIVITIGSTTHAVQGFTVTVLKAMATAEPTALAPGEETTLTATVSGTVGAAVCTWTANGVKIDENDCSASVKHKPDVDTTYQVTVVDSDSVTTSASVSVSVGVVVTPIADLYLTRSLVAAVNVTGTWAGGTGPYTCTWTDLVANKVLRKQTCSGMSDSIDLSRAATGKYSFTVEDTNGKSDTKSFTIFVLKAVASANPTPIDSGQSSKLTVVVTDAKGTNLTCEWKDNTGASVTGDCNGADVAPKLTTTYSVTVTDNDTGATASANVTVSVNLKVLALSDVYAAVGENLTIVGSWEGGTPNPNGKLTCTWTYAYGNISAQAQGPCSPFSSNLPLSGLTENVSVTFAVSDSAAQTGSTSATVYVLKATATAEPGMYVTSGTSVTLKGAAVDYNPNQPVSCSWTNNVDGTTLTTCDAQVSPTLTTTYTLTVTNKGSDGLDNTATATVKVNVLNVSAGNDQTVVRGNKVALVASISGNQGAGSCVWTNSVTADTVSGCNTSVIGLVNATWTVTYSDVDASGQQNGNSAKASFKVTLTDPCDDKQKNGNESDVDCGGPTVWFNEVHYDNASTDADEGFELAGPVGLDLTGWKVLRITNTGAVDATFDLSSYTDRVLANPAVGATIGVRWFGVAVNGLPNSSYPRGLMLVDAFDRVQQFISYGNSTVITATYNNQTVNSEPIGQNESGTTPLGASIQLTGSGTHYYDFVWVKDIPSTHDAVNTNQSFGRLPALVSQNICGRCKLSQLCASLDQSCQLSSTNNYLCSPTFGSCFDCNDSSYDFEDLPPANPGECAFVQPAIATPYNYHQVRIERTATSPGFGEWVLSCQNGTSDPWTSKYIGFLDPQLSDVIIRFPYPVSTVSFTIGRAINYSGLSQVALLNWPGGPLTFGLAGDPYNVTLVFDPNAPVDWIGFRGVSVGPNNGLGIDNLKFSGPLCGP